MSGALPTQATQDDPRPARHSLFKVSCRDRQFANARHHKASATARKVACLPVVGPSNSPCSTRCSHQSFVWVTLSQSSPERCAASTLPPPHEKATAVSTSIVSSDSWSLLGSQHLAIQTLVSVLLRSFTKTMENSRRYGVVDCRWPAGLTLTASRGSTPPGPGASRDVVHRLRLNTMQRAGHTGQKALAKEKSQKPWKIGC